MARVCARPGCDRFVAARLTYDTIACEVWLDPVPERPGRAQEICDLHATRLTVPRGWVLSDRRPDEPAQPAPERPATNGSGVAPIPAPNPAPSVGSVPEPVPGPQFEPRPPVEAAPPAERSHPAPAHPTRRPVPIVDDPVEPVQPERRRVARTVALALPEPTPDQADEAPGEEEWADGSVDEALVAEELTDDELVDAELPESLQATSPLLARAFRLSGPQGSVLSRALLNEPD